MPKSIDIKTPDGKTISLNAPDSATPDQIQQAAQQAVQHYQQSQQPDYMNEPGVQPASILSDIQKGSAQGLGALGTLVTGGKLDEASQIAQGQPETSLHGTVGKIIGDSVSPAGLAIGAGASKVAEAGLPMAKTLVKALTPGAKADIGAAMGAAEKAAGYVQKIPTVPNLAKRFGLKPEGKGFADIVNHVSDKLASGTKLPVQDLVDFRALVQQQFGIRKIAKGSRVEALVTQANKQAGEMLNNSVTGRAALSAEYAKIAKVQKVLKQLAVGTGGAGAFGLAAQGIKSFFKG